MKTVFSTSKLIAPSIIVTALASTLPAHASNLDVSIGNKTAAANLQIAPKDPKVDINIGYLYRTGGTHVGTLGLHATGQTVLANMPTTAGVGFEATGFDKDKVDGAGLGLGGFVRVLIPAVPGLSVQADAHYAPNILTFGEADNIKHFVGRVNYRVIPNAEVFAGYHYQNAGIDKGPSVSLDASPIVGLSIRF